MTTPRIQTYDVKETCRLLHVSRVTLWRLTKRKELRPTRVSPGRVVFRATELERFLDRATR